MILFTKPYQVIRRGAVTYVEGIAQRAPESAPVTLQLNVQPAGGNSRSAAADDDMIAFGNAGALNPRDAGSRHEGDIVVVNGQRYIVTSADRWDAFGGAETAHDRYTLAQEIPKATGEA